MQIILLSRNHIFSTQKEFKISVFYLLFIEKATLSYCQMTDCISLRKISPLKSPITLAREIAQPVNVRHNEREQGRKKKGKRTEGGRARERRTRKRRGEERTGKRRGEERRNPGVLLYICSP